MITDTADGASLTDCVRRAAAVTVCTFVSSNSSRVNSVRSRSPGSARPGDRASAAAAASAQRKAEAALPPMPLALWGVENVIRLYGLENTFFLSKPPTGNYYAWAEKAMWVARFFPDLERNLIITHNKAACGTSESVLIDDRLHKGGVANFRGEVIHFGSVRFPSWVEVIERLRERAPAR